MKYFKDLQKESEKPGNLISKMTKAGFSPQERMIALNMKTKKP